MVKPAICLMGPTASGKTDLAMQLVQLLPCEIISVDSAMIYRGMNIGTAKPSAEELARAPHHLIDILDPMDAYSVAQFCKDTYTLCDEIEHRGNVPLLVGGTMMYFNALKQGLSELPEASVPIRKMLEEDVQRYGLSYLHQTLARIDVASAERIHPNDAHRVQRAIEVYLITGKSLSEHLIAQKSEPYRQFVDFIIMPTDRAWLHARIAVRFEEMLAQGLVKEVDGLLQRWNLTATHPSMRCVGYRQVFDYLHTMDDHEGLLSKGIAATRQLAKRQLTWLRNWSKEAHYIEAEYPNAIDTIMRALDKQT